jgi:mRNA interferase RelE/StbE
MNRLPLSVAAAVHEHLSGAVVDNPHRLGKQLDAPYQALWSTRRADYRAIYGIDDGQRTVTVVAVAHRRDAYRP